MPALKRLAHALWALALAALVILPALPAKIGGAASTVTAERLRKISIQQHWGMYVPDPQRSHRYMRLEAHFADGTIEHLEESTQERHGWSTVWAWQKTRNDIWRYYANLNPDKPNRNRDWYLRGVCVREARAHGVAPDKIVMTQVRRRFAPPAAVRAGSADLGVPQERMTTVQYCNVAPVRDMIEADRDRRANG